jgi:hypothetical protein
MCMKIVEYQMNMQAAHQACQHIRTLCVWCVWHPCSTQYQTTFGPTNTIHALHHDAGQLADACGGVHEDVRIPDAHAGSTSGLSSYYDILSLSELHIIAYCLLLGPGPRPGTTIFGARPGLGPKCIRPLNAFSTWMHPGHWMHPGCWMHPK